MGVCFNAQVVKRNLLVPNYRGALIHILTMRKVAISLIIDMNTLFPFYTNLQEKNYFGYGKPKDEAYDVKSTVGDSKEFYPIAISAVKSFHFASIKDSAASYRVESTQQCCTSCDSCCCVDKSWFSETDEPRVSSSETTVIVIYLDLPPWSQRSMLTIEVGKETSLANVKRFVALLQCAVVPMAVNQEPASKII